MSVNSVSKKFDISAKDFIRPSLMEKPMIAKAVEEGEDEIINSLISMAAVNKAYGLPNNAKRAMPESSLNLLDEMYKKDPEKCMLIIEAYYNMVYIEPEVSEKTVKALIDELINLKDTTTLKKALDSDVKIIVSKTKKLTPVAGYGNFAKWISLHENLTGSNNIDSLPHELGHAFDQNTPVQNTPSLHWQLIPKLEKDEEGNYKCVGLLPNAQRKLVPTEQNPSGIYDIISDYASTSVEFNKAFKKDCDGLLEIDKQKGLKKGTTFSRLLHDWNPSSFFAYYLGIDSYRGRQPKKYLQQREMFAQMAALSTTGHTTRPDFDKAALKYFPNTFEFVDSLIKSENK